MLLLLLISGSYLQFFISLACGVAVSISLPRTLGLRRTSELLQKKGALALTAQ